MQRRHPVRIQLPDVNGAHRRGAAAVGTHGRNGTLSGSGLTIALGEYDTGWHDPRASLEAAARVVDSAAAAGAAVVVLPEMATTGFTMDTSWAVPIDGAEVEEFQRIAREARTWLVAGVSLREDPDDRAVNACLAIDGSGRIAAVHRKQRLFAYAGEHEHYRPGTSSTTVTIDGVRVALFVCYELRFPELFAPIAPVVDAMVVIANWPGSRLAHWDALLRARAIENQCYVVGVNRIGIANGLEYPGGSVAFDPWGVRMTASAGSALPLITVDPERVATVRAQYPFLRDRATPNAGNPAASEVAAIFPG